MKTLDTFTISARIWVEAVLIALATLPQVHSCRLVSLCGVQGSRVEWHIASGREISLLAAELFFTGAALEKVAASYVTLVRGIVALVLWLSKFHRRSEGKECDVPLILLRAGVLAGLWRNQALKRSTLSTSAVVVVPGNAPGP
ncbi:hypothetical protein BD779DRAFT_1790462 [Infundibulicybe gibba]|nr:hypothetical protein BD779DRAFT_1790462 [Infundibulicybe gibba]